MREWIDVLGKAMVEVSSEDELFPITAALAHEETNGWRAATTGPQTLRLLFGEPQNIHRIRVHVADRVSERTQEIRVRAGVTAQTLEEVALWQFSFSPRGVTEEIEEIAVSLDGVTVVELRIDPEIRHLVGDEGMYAVIKSFRLA